jgi:hypothetical protein
MEIRLNWWMWGEFEEFDELTATEFHFFKLNIFSGFDESESSNLSLSSAILRRLEVVKTPRKGEISFEIPAKLLFMNSKFRNWNSAEISRSEDSKPTLRWTSWSIPFELF